MGPLAGLKVLELGQLIAGPFCGQMLADFGAEVVKVEPPGKGDAMREWGREDEGGRPIWWSVIGRNKKSVTIDLRTDEGQDVLRRLAAQADVLIENFRPGTMERWGLGYDRLAEANPGLIMVRVSGFGQSGPYSDRAGFASVCEAYGGLRHISGFPDRPPIRVGLSLGDTLAGMNGAIGALLALQERQRTGKGQIVDSAIYEAVLTVMESLVADYALGGHIRERHGSKLPGIAPSNAYPTKDDREMVIGANQDSVFQRLCEVMGKPELGDDERFATHRARGRNQDEIDSIIADWTRERDAEQTVEELAAAGVPVGLAYTAADMMEDPHFAAREAITRVEDPERGEVAMQNVFPRLSETPGAVRSTGPDLSEHTEAILSEWIGMDREKVQALKEKGVL